MMFNVNFDYGTEVMRRATRRYLVEYLLHYSTPEEASRGFDSGVDGADVLA